MTVLDVLALVVGCVGIACGSLRWLRVAQREHYLAWSVTRFGIRWWKVTPTNSLAFAICVGCALTTPWVPWLAIVVAVVTIVGPVGLGVRGRTSKLVWTRRLRTVACAELALVIIAIALTGAFASLRAAVVAAAAIAVLSPILVDAVLDILAPIEYRVASRYVMRAREAVRRTQPKIVAITGSYGKTTTKAYVAHLLAGRFDTLASPKSFNNRAGLARTINEHLTSATQVLVAEMGTYGRGEIAEMCSWLPPDVAVITAIGPVHLERFRSLEVTVTAKSEILDGAPTGVLNVDDDRLRSLANARVRTGQHILGCSGLDPFADIALIEEGDGVGLYRSGELRGRTKIGIGELPPLANVACAVAVALSLGCSDEEVLVRLASLPITASRLEQTVSPNGIVVFDDTFNSNPAGARLGLSRLIGRTGRRVVVTPGMVELGRAQFEENQSFGEEIAKIGADLVVVGRTNRRALIRGYETRQDGQDAADLVVVASREQAVAWVRAHLVAGDAVLYENDLPDHYA